MTDSEALAYYESFIKDKIYHSKTFVHDEHGLQTKLRHDYFNIYAYGDEIKIVYVRCAPSVKDTAEMKFEHDSATNENGVRFSQSLSRTKNRIFELAKCNEFQYFCTFTQDEKKRDRFSLKDFRKDFAQMVRNLNRGRAEKIKYLLIPEQHKDGAWHMHGLLMGLNNYDLRKFTLKERLPQNIRKTIKSGKNVYNWESYSKKFGYFTCTDIENKTACSKYITKYITKSLQKTALENGEHMFFASQGLKGREVVLKNCFEKCPFDDWDFENEYVKIKWITVQKNGQ